MAIVVSDLEFAYPGVETLFFEVSFKIGTGECAGVVGDNAVGKSTLLEILAGRLEPDEGTVQIDGLVLHMPQSIGQEERAVSLRSFLADLAPPWVRQAAHSLWRAEEAAAEDPSDHRGLILASAIAEWRAAGGYETESQWDACTTRVLRQPFQQAALRSVHELSGGERKRLALEVLLASQADVLLLDEPDNFLDIPSKRWLEANLLASKKTILMISHDRELLSRALSKVVTIEGSGAWVHHGSLATYHDARAARNVRLGDVLERWRKEERRLYLHFRVMKQRAAANDANASRADAAETRWRRFVDAGPPPSPPSKTPVRMRLSGGDSGRVVVRCRNLELVGLTSPFALEIHFGERVAVLGPNGSGKTHFLKLLGGEPVAHQGLLQLGARVRPGAFDQTNERRDLRGRTPLQVLEEFLPRHEDAMRALARYGLQNVWNEDFSRLSGGQQARLQILCLEAQGANLLLLDEPTDNLDLVSAEALEEALQHFRGTLIGVTHDRWFMRSFSRFLVFGLDGSVVEALDLGTALSVIGGDPPAGSLHLLPLGTAG